VLCDFLFEYNTTSKSQCKDKHVSLRCCFFYISHLSVLLIFSFKHNTFLLCLHYIFNILFWSLCFYSKINKGIEHVEGPLLAKYIVCTYLPVLTLYFKWSNKWQLNTNDPFIRCLLLLYAEEILTLSHHKALSHLSNRVDRSWTLFGDLLPINWGVKSNSCYEYSSLSNFKHYSDRDPRGDTTTN
jgi:hypothetical protein